METDQHPLYQHLLSPDYPHSTLLSTTSPLLTGCIGEPKQEALTKSKDTNINDPIHTIYLKPTTPKEECRQDVQDESDWNQWFDNEFASTYRQYQQQQVQEKLPEKPKSTSKPTTGLVTASQCATQPSPPKRYDPPPHHHKKNTNQNLSSSSISLSTTTTNDVDSLPDQISVTTRHTSRPSQQAQQPLQPFPWPDSVEQIHGWCKIAKRSKDAKSQIKLCRRLLATLAHDAVNQKQEQPRSDLQRHPSSHNKRHVPTPPHSLASSLLSLPSLSSSSTSTSLSSSLSALSVPVPAPASTTAPILSVDHEHIRQVMMRECLRILKRQSNGQGLGKGGDSEAQFILANCYGIGLLGLPEDHGKAFQLFMQASKQAHPEAIYRTAVCYELGIGTRKDGQRAMIFYRKSARLSHAGSMHKLGMILLRGYYNTTPMPREAISWFQRAASQVTATLPPKANAFIATTTTTTTTAATSSSIRRSPSSSSLSSLYFTNNKSRSHQSIIASITSQVHHHQAPHALHALAMIQMREGIGNTTSLIADPAYAIELLHQAAKRDHVPSQLQLGHCFEHGQWVPVDEALSIYWYACAAHLESPEACLAISNWYLTGTSKNKKILPPSDRESYLWARRAIALSVASAYPTDKSTMAKAHFAVAVLVERGMTEQPGDLTSKESTKTWMLKAAALGHQGASRWLQNKTTKVDRQQAAEQGRVKHGVIDRT